MNKQDTDEMNLLSLLCFGHKYHWKKLRKQGLVVGHDKESGHLRRIPLTTQQAKDYMTKTLEMRDNMAKELEGKKNEER